MDNTIRFVLERTPFTLQGGEQHIPSPSQITHTCRTTLCIFFLYFSVSRNNVSDS